MVTQQHEKTKMPTGTVTLLFSDIAGSTRMWEQHGDDFIPVWQAHDAVLRDAFTRFGGYEVKNEGDSFMVAFASADDALHCALFAQAAMTRYPWPPYVGAPRVRMGLHTGEPFVHGNDYFGPAVNRAAHICAAAHGGQVLISDATQTALTERADPKIEFTDLGELRFKDMGFPQRAYQAQHPSVEAAHFPPPRTLDGQPNNLPIQSTSFVGRAKEIEQIAAYLAQGEKPVLTLTGPGGIGKTRLSLQAAAAKAEWFPDGVWYVKLVEAQDATGAAVEMASAMNIPLKPGEPPLNQVREWLANRRCLLILDDANTLPQAGKLIRELLSGSNGLRCLATARESLEIEEAEEIEVGGLSLTSELSNTTVIDDSTILTELTEAAGSEAARSDAVHSDAGRLFLERALAANPNLKLTTREQAAVENLLHDLEGVPASIERAAQLMDRIPASVILEWLNQRLEPDRVAPKNAAGSEKFRSILRKSAQKVYQTVEETTKASVVNFNQLLQGIANVATDRKDEKQAAELGRQSLQLSQEAGDALGVAAALRQLAQVKWQQGDRQSAIAMLSAAAEVYRMQNAPDTADIRRELERMREQIPNTEPVQTVTTSVENAVAIALRETGN